MTAFSLSLYSPATIASSSTVSSSPLLNNSLASTTQAKDEIAKNEEEKLDEATAADDEAMYTLLNLRTTETKNALALRIRVLCEP